MKTIMNNTLNINSVGQIVKLYGFVAKKRNLGGLIFIDLRDRSGIIQIVIRPDNKHYKIAESLKNEFVIEVEGKIVERENKNKNMATGEIEVDLSNLVILSESNELPFSVADETTAFEDTRLKYRYLDIRRNEIKDKLIIRHKIALAVREYLDSLNFIEVETPILCKSTPEGARDYLVPSRVNKGKFYALPQSPQLFKQILMVGGMERYFQIAKCFRDEDLRSDRQPEFTQIDIEMSYVDESDIMAINEGLIHYLFRKIKGIDIDLPLLKLKYKDAIEYYGSDKPDLRFDMKIEDITDVFKASDFSIFKNAIENNYVINCLVVKNKSADFSRKEIDKLTEVVKTYRASGLMYLKFNEEVTGSIAKSIEKSELKALKNKLNIEDNDLVLIVADKYNITKSALGALRNKLGHSLNLIDEKSYNLLWVVDFPSFEYSEEDKRYYASHHPFTSPKDEDIDKLITDPGNCYSKAYDMVINGYEAGGGSIRIHNREVQKKMFTALGINEEEANEKFDFLLEAFKYGVPPHGGIAFGLDRLTMLLTNTENIKDVIAFPKTTSASDLMSECPSIVDTRQLDELGIKIK
ncbi:MAG: aspartate--tRNA ligase [Bacilli bacterium]|nr:aspartate--tRNA ligase [Bacilli bacterium]MDD4733718.1 aspartate--tRNA ligase [Bacilli bacterium]